uniref:RNA binding protein n=1 Tax=Pristionchus pacificus TaxID=54126 RepID=A0A2A6C9T8_PRIPA|eukprot:PDM74944.1 RNA binding protein [Pristionchus pacificus]
MKLILMNPLQCTTPFQKPKSQANLVDSAQNSPGQNSPGYVPAAPHQSIGVDPVNGLYITSGLPSGPSPCLALANQTNPIPPHLSAVAATPLAQTMQSAIEPPPPPPPVPMDVGSPQRFQPVPPPPFGGANGSFNGAPVPPPPSLMSMPVPPPFAGSMPPPPPPPNGASAPIPNQSVPEPSVPSRRGGFGGFADSVPPIGGGAPGTAPAPALIDPITGKTMEPPKPKVQKPKKEKRSDMSILDRIKVQTVNMSAKATFGPVDDGFTPKDEEKEGEQLALMGSKQGDVHAMALALLDGNKALVQAMKRKEEKAKEEEEGTAKKKKKIKAPKAQTGPKLNTAAALAAAATAGQMSDAIINTAAASEDASLSSQETISIRGNDARHLLMTKLMRVNRSSVVLLKNMVTPDDIDEFLEGEIREECGKFGNVSEVVIASDPTAGVAKVFVRFNDPTEAEAAKQSLDKRFFAGRSIIATIYDQVMFEHNDLSG